MALQIRRGTDAERTAGGGVIFAEGELVYVTDTDALYIGDGSTAGGVKLTDNASSVLGTYITADTINSTLDLQQNLDLNGSDIIGTGNIDITGNINATGNIVAGGNIDIGDADTDTLTISAKVDSGITPETDTAYDLGTASLRWRNIYANGATIDGQVDAVAINADVVADNSTVMVDASANTFTGDLTGSVTGDTAGTHTGAVVGDVTGDTTGYHTGDVKGSVFGNDSTPIVDAVANTLNGDLTGDVTGNVTGNVVGDITGSVKGSGGGTVLAPNTGPTAAELSVLNVTATGTILGNVTGDVTGNLTGNAAGDHTGTFTGAITATGTFDGDITGSVFADDSTPMVDAVNKSFAGNLTGDVTGNVTGNIFTNLIDSADSSAIVITPSLQTLSDLQVDQDLIVGRGGTGVFGPNGTDVKIVPGTGAGFGKVFTDTLEVRTIEIQDGDGGIISITGEVDLSKTLTTNDGHLGFGDNNLLAYNGVSASLRIAEFTGDLDQDGDFENAANFNNYLTVSSTVADFGVPVKFSVYADASARDAAVPSPEIGMVVIVGTTMQLNTDGTTGGWVSVTTS